MPNNFKQTTSSTVSANGFQFEVYEWSTAANWTNGVPINGGSVSVNVIGGGNPSGYDDIANLFLDSLILTSGYIADAASLEVGTVTFGATTASLYSDTNLGAASATLTIDGFSGATYGRVAATGANAVTYVNATSDPGEIYQVDGGGELVLTPTPLANPGITQAGFYYQNSGSPSGTFAFRNPGSTINLPLASVAIGDSIALPGSSISSVTYGANSLIVVSNLGTTTFTNVIYSGTKPTGYTVSTDPTGLKRITFSSSTGTSFQQNTSSVVSANGFQFGVYEWSTPANWLNGSVPINGGSVSVNIVGGGNPSGYDDIANLFLDSLILTSGYIADAASLEIGTVTFGATTASLYSDTNLGAASATLTIDGFSGASNGRVAATGPNAVTYVNATSDPGEIYQVDGGGELVLAALPYAGNTAPQAGFYYQNSGSPSGTFAFKALSGNNTVNDTLAGVAIGDSLALPASSISSVIYGTSSLTIVTNLGTTTFSNVSYSGTRPTGYTVSTDPTGLKRITFTSSALTTFQQITSSVVSANGFQFGVYEWSTAANWTNGVPINGGSVSVNVIGGGNPSGYDDIANLFLDSLILTSGYIADAASLEVGTVSFGTTTASLYSDTNLGAPSAVLTIDGFSGVGTYGRIAATGANAVTYVNATSDPGEIYQVDGGGELVLAPTPLANPGITQAGFYYQNSGSPSGTFAFRNPGSTINLPLASVAIGDSIALPGSSVSSVTYGASSLVVVTNLGTTTFTNVSYSGTKPTGYTVSTDPTGLERITFTSSTATSFQQITSSVVSANGFQFGVYEWSTAANWTNGVPINGGAVSVNVVGGGNPSGYDDIANLFLDSLILTSGYIADAASLEIGTVSFGTTTASLYSDTNLGAPSAVLTIDGFSGVGTYGRIAATGANAVTYVNATSDPGEIYQVDGGGELVLAPTPLANPGITQAGFYYQNSGSPSGTFAFRNPGSTINLPLASVAAGDSIALPGSSVSSVVYGANSLTVVTNLGTTTFSNVSYASNYVLSGYLATQDATTGLEKVTFLGSPLTSFQQTTSSVVSANGFQFGVYEWSTGANWTNGVPTNGSSVNVNVIGGGNPSAYDDIAGLSLTSVTLSSGFIAVASSLEVGTVSFGSTTASLYSDTDLGAPSAVLTIDGFSGVGTYGRIAATGSNAVTNVNAISDPGEIYQVDGGGELVLAPTPLANAGATQAGFYYQNSGSPSGTFAFRNPGSTINLPLASVAIGDSIALPGSSISSVTYGANTLIVVTNLGTTTFTNVSYSGIKPTGALVGADPTGLEQLKFEDRVSAGQTLYVFSGQTGLEIGLQSGGNEIVLSGGSASAEAVSSGGTLTVSGTASGTTLSGGVQIDVGSAVGTVVGNGGVQYVYSGSAMSTTVNNGGTEYVENGGVASATTVNVGGVQTISSGSTASGAVLSGGVQLAAGLAAGTVVDNGGLQYVFIGSAKSTTVNNGGTEVVLNGGVASGTTVNVGGVQTISSGSTASGAVLIGGIQIDVGLAAGTSVSNGSLQYVYIGSATSTTVNNGGTEVVMNGGVASGTTVSVGGVQTISSGSTASGAALSGGIQIDVGLAVGTTVGNGGLQYVYIGSAASTTVNSGGTEITLSGGLATSTTVNVGGVQTISSGSTAGGAVLSGGVQIDAGLAVGTIVSNGGLQYVYIGSATSTTVNSGATEVVLNAGVASGTTVNIGGVQTISSGSTASGAILSGGIQIDLGVAVGTVVANGGVQYVYGGSATSTTVNSGGTEYVQNNGMASATTVNVGGVQTISSGSTASGAVLSGGIQIDLGVAVNTVVRSASVQYVYGTASGTIVASGGSEQVTAGASLAGATLSGGTIEIQSGGTAGTSLITISAGTLILDDSQNFHGTVAGLANSAQQVDLVDITFGSSTHVAGYATNGSNGGTVSITDGTHTALLNVVGAYTSASFELAAGSFGGTLVTDPPVSSGNGVAPPH